MSVDDQIAIEKIVKNSGTSFFWGMKILSPEKKRAMFAIYAFCRIVDDIADDIKDSKVKKSKLNIWKERIEAIYNRKKLNSSLEKELNQSIEKFKLNKSDLLSIIDGMMMDAEKDIQFPTKKELNLYCDRVAVAVGYLSIQIFGLSKKEKKYAFYLGRAFQLTNIVRDFNEDLERGRCYIAFDYLKKYGIKRNIITISEEPRLQDVFQDILNEAEIYFEKSFKESKKINKKKIIASEIMKTFYKAIHSKMFKKEINLKKKIRLNSLEKILILFLFFIRY